MCACGGRKAPEVITSAQAAEQAAMRTLEDQVNASIAEEQRIQSAQNALANATSGWHVVSN